jgi:hypothetical protein
MGTYGKYTAQALPDNCEQRGRAGSRLAGVGGHFSTWPRNPSHGATDARRGKRGAYAKTDSQTRIEGDKLRRACQCKRSRCLSSIAASHRCFTCLPIGLLLGGSQVGGTVKSPPWGHISQHYFRPFKRETANRGARHARQDYCADFGWGRISCLFQRSGRARLCGPSFGLRIGVRAW